MATRNTICVSGLAIGPALGGLLMLAISNPWLRDRSSSYLASAALLFLCGVLVRACLPSRTHAESVGR